MPPVAPAPSLAAMRWAPPLAAVALVLLALHETAGQMVGVWMRSETFAHAFLVPPIALWLAWRQRERLAALPLRPVPMLLTAVALTCAVWLVADVASVNAAAQFALVALVVLTVVAVAGRAIARVLAFPLLFLFFAVPFGDFLLPSMISMTADFTVAALRLSGIPVYRDGMQFMIPSGAWSVVEACSGVRYLIASFMVGTLFAYLNYRSLRKRLAFVAVSLALPIVANWVRAYLIVMVGHLSGNELAVGADHLIYGWVFFGIVIGLMFMVGARWSDPPAAPSPAAPAVFVAAVGPASARTAWLVAGGVAALVAGTQLVQQRLGQPTVLPPPPLALPDALGPWRRAGELPARWAPSYLTPPTATATAGFQRDGAVVGVWIGYYRDQTRQREMIASANTLVPAEAKGWIQVSSGATTAGPGGGVPFATASLRESAQPGVPGTQRLRVWQTYWVDGRFVASPARAKLLTAWQRLRGAGDDSASLMLFTPLGEGGSADAALGDFVASQVQTLRDALDAARRAR